MAHQQQGQYHEYPSGSPVVAASQGHLDYQMVYGLILLTFFASLILMSQNSRAEQQQASETIFVPDNLTFFNPLGEHAKNKKCKDPVPEMMDNEALYNSARDMQNTSIGASQRALNYQWLRAHQSQDNMHVGNKAFSKIIKMGLQSYWLGMKSGKPQIKQVAASVANTVNFNDDMSYDLKLSGNKFNLSVKYEF